MADQGSLQSQHGFHKHIREDLAALEARIQESIVFGVAPDVASSFVRRPMNGEHLSC